eukprot:4733548-Karenia_brevis.AAC.1
MRRATCTLRCGCIAAALSLRHRCDIGSAAAVVPLALRVVALLVEWRHCAPPLTSTAPSISAAGNAKLRTWSSPSSSRRRGYKHRCHLACLA